MPVSNRGLGLIAVIASPFLFAELYSGPGRLSGIFDLIYMLGWMCTIVGLLRLEATGTSQNSKIILYIQLCLLTVANSWNAWTIIDPGNDSSLYFLLDFFWPLSNICLLIAGIIIARKGLLQGWKRWAPLMAGCWLPFNLVLFLSIGQTPVTTILSGMYSTIGWAMMGWLVMSTPGKIKEPVKVARAA